MRAMAGETTGQHDESTFVGALLAKYLDHNEADLDPSIFLPSRPPGKADSSGNLVLHTDILALDGRGIEVAGNVTEVSQCLQHLKEVDLTCNNISDWREVMKLLTCFPVLEFLNLTSNPLSGEFPTDVHGSHYPTVRKLVLNNTRVPWATVVFLLQIFPFLEEVHLSLNNYSSVDLMDKCRVVTVKKIHFNGNKVADWLEICKLGHCFPNLEYLVMGETGLINTLGQTTDCACAFPRLKSLIISETAIDSWEDIDKLRQFPSLTDVKLHRIPLLEKYSKEQGRELTIARLPNVVQLNGSSVLEDEREKAERSFIRHYMDQEDKPARYTELESRYGKLDPLAKVSLKPKTTVKVKVTFEEKVEEMTISTRQTVKQLKKSLQDFVGVPPSKFRLYYVDHLLNMGADELKYLERNLWTMNITEDDEFIIELK